MAFASMASCSGSRAAIYTGLSTHENDGYGLFLELIAFKYGRMRTSAPQVFNGIGYESGILILTERWQVVEGLEMWTPDEVEASRFVQDLSAARQELAKYYRPIHRMDQGIGLVLEALERQGLADETLILFLSDNGPPFVNPKTTLYDVGMRLQFIVRVPGKDAGAIPLNMSSYIDVFLTLLDSVGQGNRQPSDACV
ncbi:arylsulfatase, partial [Metarhizium majus ARSEF 297]